jgi:hypothetical protein
MSSTATCVLRRLFGMHWTFFIKLTMLLREQYTYDRSLRKSHARSTYRLKRALIRRLTLVAGFCCTVQFLKLHALARRSLRAKYTATVFGGDAGLLLNRYDSVSGGGVAANRSALIAAKPSWHPLRSGCEGSTFAWDQHVIKTFKPKKSPFRKCLPREVAEGLHSYERERCSLGTRWLAEIPASLLAGDTRGFLPVSHVFFASLSPELEAQWLLVTPLTEGGTLLTLAESILQDPSDAETSMRALDFRFRPRFDKLLVALQ